MDSFVFYESFYNAISKLPRELQAEALEAVVRFGIYGEEYDGEEYAIAVLMELVKANVAAAQQKRDAGRRGGRAKAEKGAVSREKSSADGENHATEGRKGGLSTLYAEEETAAERTEQSEADKGAVSREKSSADGENHATEGRKGGLSTLGSKEDSERGEAVCEILLNQGVHEVYERDVGEWAALYPAVDVLQELRKMVGWAKANPAQRKTKKGINRFINNWLAREQDRSRSALKQRAPAADYGSATLYAGGDSI